MAAENGGKTQIIMVLVTVLQLILFALGAWAGSSIITVKEGVIEIKGDIKLINSRIEKVESAQGRLWDRLGRRNGSDNR